MGYYVNPPNESKEDFLDREGMVIPPYPRLGWKDVPDGFLPVVLINNGPFTAAGIAYCEGELKAFTDPGDLRPKVIYLVKREKLIAVSDLPK